MASCQSPIGYVVIDGVVEQDGVLWDNTEVSSQALERHVTDILIADSNTSVPGVVEPVEKPHNSRFTGGIREHLMFGSKLECLRVYN